MYPTKKSLGQHWLHDDDSLQAMCDAVQVSSTDTVLEIGPGLGTLTKKLVAQAGQVVAVEFDQQLAKHLPTRVPASNLQVVSEDILKFNFTTLPPGYKVAANIPYYLTSNLLRLICEGPNHFSAAALLMQKEVAERVCARQGQMSLLSVSVQFYCDATLGRAVPAELFTPPPKVDSQILILNYRAQPRFPGTNTRLFFRIVKAGFAQRRKTILNALGAGMHFSREETAQVLAEAEIAETTRAQNLSLEDWHRLYTVLEKRTDNEK